MMQALKETRLAQVQVLNRAKKALATKKQEANKLIQELASLKNTVETYKKKVEATNKKIFILTSEKSVLR